MSLDESHRDVLLNGGVNRNIFGGDRGAEGAEGCGCGEEMSPPHWGRGHSPLSGILFDFGSQNGDLWCILGAIFCSSAKTLRGEKILSPRYIFIGIDATGRKDTMLAGCLQNFQTKDERNIASTGCFSSSEKLVLLTDVSAVAGHAVLERKKTSILLMI